jgi:methyl-accepting chemotaxis protein
LAAVKYKQKFGSRLIKEGDTMEERRTKVFWNTKFTFPLLIVFMVWMFVFTLMGFLLFINYIASIQYALHYSSTWTLSFIIFLLILIGGIVFLFFAIFVMLRRSLGAIPRMEKILDRVIKGEYSLRVTIRSKDAVHTFVDKLNTVLDLLESKAKG